jgi:formate dehydrogenase major subunit
VVSGDAANELLSVVLDSNVHIGEYKAATCDIRPGRRPRGPALAEFVEDYRRRARVEEPVRRFHRRLEDQNGGG